MSEIASNYITDEEFEENIKELCILLKRLQKITCETELLVNKINQL